MAMIKMKIGRAAMCLTLAAYFFLGLFHSVFGGTPDPRVLLQGMENARLHIPSGRIEWEVIYLDKRHPKAGESRKRLIVVFEGDKRRFDQYQRILWIDGTKPNAALANNKLEAMGRDSEAFVRAGLGQFKDVHIRSAYDGAQYMQYNEEMGAYIRDVTKGSADYAFDPRIMGMSVWYDLNTSVSSAIGHRDAKSIEMVGPEEVGGHRTWHVRLLDKSDRERHFWIEDKEGFRVHKCELRSQYQHLTTEPEYAELGMDQPLPIRVVVRDYDRDGKSLVGEVTFVQKQAKFGITVDPKAWTLAGLGLPIGISVSDERINRGIGHWDGEGLTPNLPDAIQKGHAARWKPLHWGMAVTGLIALAALAAVFVRRRNLLREEA